MRLRGYRGNVRAPEFPNGLPWVNTPSPLSLERLRGRLVLLDFWTYGCINCLHILPDLHRLELEFANEMVVIGVHSAKFDHEKQVESLRQVVARYGISHPVVGDAEYRVWDAYAVRAWPTTVLIDPTGRIVNVHSGEGVYQAHYDAIVETIEKHRAEGTLRAGEMIAATEPVLPAGPLAYPGAVLVDPVHERLWIADTAHHRLLFATLAGEVEAVVGAGEPGLVDGSWDEARLNLPLGMALSPDGRVYLADSGNHAVRVVDPSAHHVTTLAGDGQQARGALSEGDLPGRLNSPWDVCLVERKLYLAMAGVHQIWAIDLDTSLLLHHAGSGREGILDAPLKLASLAQPSALVTDGESLCVADAESSAIRVAPLEGAGEVRTLVGEGLFAFGDRDGAWPHARLQHPQGLAWCPGRGLYIADTYNHKIKHLDPATGSMTTYAGDGSPGADDGKQARFWEPAGLDCDGETLYVADTNNHTIRTIALADGSARTLPIAMFRLSEPSPRSGARLERTGPLTLRPGTTRLAIELRPPTGYHLNSQAPSRLDWRANPAGQAGTVDLVESGLRPILELDLPMGESELRADVTAYLCQSDEGLCRVDRVTLLVGLQGDPAAAAQEATVPLQLRL